MTPEQTLEATFRSGNLALARKIAVEMLQRNVANKTALQVLAHIALLIGVSSEALPIANKALAEDDKDPRTNALLAEIHGARGHTNKALTFCDKVLKTHPGDPSTLQIKARLLERAGKWKEAQSLLEPFADKTPKPTLLATTLARCRMQAGDYAGAIALLDETLPGMTGSDKKTRQQRASLLGLKARILDRDRQYDEAWKAATESNQLHDIKYDPATYTNEIDQLINWFSTKRVEQLPKAPASSAQHIFIVGMARSGTTLTEQILDAHRQATGLGEIKDLDVLARMLPKTLNIRKPLPNILEDVDSGQLERMVKTYETGIEQQEFAKSSFYVNKNLRNGLLLGLIAMMFPNARVIFTHRDPRDTGVSSYMAGMSHELFPYLFNVEHMASAFRDYDRLVTHWKSVLPLQWLDVRYEDLVNNQQAETRRLLEFCGLPWDERCLRFWKSSRTVMTQSYDQVTRPIYTQSVDRYKHYEQHIAPLLELVPADQTKS
ncbi:MAG: sulfotransferase [Gammaproteobacteria bacterium]